MKQAMSTTDYSSHHTVIDFSNGVKLNITFFLKKELFQKIPGCGLGKQAEIKNVNFFNNGAVKIGTRMLLKKYL